MFFSADTVKTKLKKIVMTKKFFITNNLRAFYSSFQWRSYSSCLFIAHNYTHNAPDNKNEHIYFTSQVSNETKSSYLFRFRVTGYPLYPE